MADIQNGFVFHMGVIMLCEDQRAAANITVTLSSQLIAASLAAIAVLGTVYSYVNDKREPHGCFNTLVVVSFALFIFSIFIGGKGITKVREYVFKGKYTLDTAKPRFAFQALFSLLGLIGFFILLNLTGRPKEDVIQNQINNLSETVRKQQDELTARKQELEKFQADMEKLKR